MLRYRGLTNKLQCATEGLQACYIVLQDATWVWLAATDATNMGNVYLATGSMSATEIYIGGR
jgi:hypothetical protein